MVCVEQIVGDDFIIVVRSMCKSAAAVAVTQGPDAGNVGLQFIVNDDVAAPVSRNSSTVKTQVARIRDTSHRDKNVSAYYVRRAIFACDMNGHTAVALCQGYTFRIQP